MLTRTALYTPTIVETKRRYNTMTLKDKLQILSEMERRNNDRWKGGGKK